MRVTNKMMSDMSLNGLLKNTERIEELMVSMTSQKRINRPSDDPTGMSKVLGYRTEISSIEQYERNIDRGKLWLTQTESAMTEGYQLLVKAQEVAISQATATANQDTRAAMAKEIESIYDQMIQLANIKLGNSYLFSGHKISQAPFDLASPVGTYNGDAGVIRVATGQNATVKINLTGQDVFLTTDIFTVLDDLRVALDNNLPDDIRNQLAGLSDSMNHINTKIAEVGSRVNQMETSENIFANLKLKVKESLSKTEDLDILQAVMDLTSQQDIYQASLMATKEIMGMSLVKFF